MRLVRFLLNLGAKPLHWHEVRALSRVERLLHRKTLQHLFGIAVGVALMYLGSWMALHPMTTAVSHPVWDCFAYALHGLGSMPLLAHFEPLWRLLTD